MGEGSQVAAVHFPRRVTHIDDEFCTQSWFSGTCDLSDTAVRSIGERFLEGSMLLVGLLLPRTLRALGMAALAGCDRLLLVDLSATALQQLPCSFAARCVRLQDVVLPPCLTAVGDRAFTRCLQLAHIDFSGTRLQAIGGQFATGCRRLLDIALPPVEVRDIVVGLGAFEGCGDAVRSRHPRLVTVSAY
jgi:hypothetical protein